MSTKQMITLAVSCLGTFMVLLDSSIVVLALPTIQAQLHANLSGLQWTVSAYTLPFAALLLTAGTLSDRFGRKRFFLIGLVLFLIGSTFCGFAPTLGWLICGRVVQGIGGAALSPGSLSLLTSAFPEPSGRARVIGLWAGISGLALAAGPLIGGVLIQAFGWSSIFFVNLPIGAIVFVLGWFGLTESRNPKAQRLDLPGQVLVIGGLTCLIMALIESSSLGWTSPVILSLLGGAVVLLVVFGLVEARTREPLLPLYLFKNRMFSTANFATIVLSFVILGVVFFLAQFFQTIQGSTVLTAGLQTLPLTVGTFLAAPLAGQITAWTTPRLPTVLGALMASCALFLLISLSPLSSFASIWWKLGLLGVGIGFMFSPLTVAVMESTPESRSGLASSLVSASRMIGSTLGVAILGAFVAQQFAGNIVSQLTQRGVPESVGTAIASAGAAASKASAAGHLPFSSATLHQVVNQAFVDALHGSFLISAIAMFVTAVIVFFLFPSKQRFAKDSIEVNDGIALISTPQVAQPVAATERR